MMGQTILIVEDDEEISRLLVSYMEGNGYRVLTAMDGCEASVKMRQSSYDLILMDLMLPYKDGAMLMEELRGYSDVPVIVLSAKSMMETKLEMLRLGADDYIIKPFDLEEVLMRVRVVLRRSGRGQIEGESAHARLHCGGLELLVQEHRVRFEGQDIALTSKELQLLQLFLENPKKTFTKANLYEAVWKDVYYYEDNTINVHISNLRSKLKKAAGQDFVETVWGIGYRLKEQ
jgi:DNA-binding response OmpR family regulator